MLLTLLMLGAASAAPAVPAGETASAAPSGADASGRPADITVTGTKPDTSIAGGALGLRSALDTPFSSHAVQAEELQDRQVKSLSRVFSEDGSVLTNGDTYTFNSYSVSVRGVPLDDYNGYRINGDPFYMTTVELPLESFESIQLLKGASGFMYGFNAPGGLINYVTKRPTPQLLLQGDLGFSSDSIFLQHVDAGDTVLGGVLGYRVNLTHEQGTTYSGSHLERASGSLGLALHLAPDLVWTGDVIYQDRRIRGGTQDFWIDDPAAYGSAALPRPVSGRTNLAGYPDLFFNSHAFYAATGLQWTLAPRWTLHADYSNSLDWRTYKSEWMRLTSPNGDYGLFLNTDPRSWSRYNQAQATLDGSFRTGPLQHQITVGLTWQMLNKHLPRTTIATIIGTENLYAPVVPIAYPSAFDQAVYRNFHSEQEGAFVSDTITLGKLALIGGARLTRYAEDDYKRQGGSTSYTKTPVTPVAALLYHPWNDATVYASYVQALESGTTVPVTYVNANETLPAIMSDQIEIGAKLQRTAWDLTAALFRIDRGAQYANAANVYVSNGTQRYEGVEATARVALPLDLSVSNSLALERARYIRSEADIQGNAIEGVPGVQDVVQLTEQPVALPGLKGTVEVHHTARLWGDSGNTFHIPAVTTLNLRASYDLALARHTLTLRAEIDNVADLKYWGFLQSGYFFVSPPRTVLLNASLKL